MPPTDPSPENLTRDLIQHLSKEIETATNNMMAFRTRIGFSMCIGPFLLLGSFILGAKGQSITRPNWFYVVPALVVIAVCYIGIAYITSEIELQALQQCNKWRNLIREIHKTPSMEVRENELAPELGWRGFSIFGVEWRPDWYGVKVAYRVGYLMLLVAVIAAVFLVRAGTAEPANYSSNGATLRIEGATVRIEQVTPTPTPTPTPQTLGNENKGLPKN